MNEREYDEWDMLPVDSESKDKKKITLQADEETDDKD